MGLLIDGKGEFQLVQWASYQPEQQLVATLGRVWQILVSVLCFDNESLTLLAINRRTKGGGMLKGSKGLPNCASGKETWQTGPTMPAPLPLQGPNLGGIVG